MSGIGSNDRFWGVLVAIVVVIGFISIVVGVGWHEYQQNDAYKTCLRGGHQTPLECKAARP